MTFQPRRSLVVLLGCLGWVMSVAYPMGFAQPSFFRVSPGPLNESHQALDHSEGCQACHESNRGVTNEKCINCHDHKLIKDQLINRRGLHATFTGSCVRCHPEHKGRDINIIDWKPLGGQEGFDHDRTGFSLKNDHRQIACTSCHVRRMKSGRISFLGLSQACQSCHKGIHKLTNPILIHACNNCHPSGQALRGMRLRDWIDPHRRFSGLSLEGKHTEQTCTQCHPKAEMPGRTPPRTCVNCHRPSHPITAKTEHCQTCHTSKTPWKAATVDHRLFGFPLLGKHQNLACNQCHTRRSRLSYSPGNCTTCHQHRDAHQGQFYDKACTNCHIEGGTRSRPFNHNKDTRFPLLGFHANPKVKNTCVHCHPNKLYRTNSLACADCHQDKHQGQRGKDCSKCHTVFQPFQEIRKNWQHQTFPLEGAHKTIPCESCHQTNKPLQGHVPCVQCHQKSDPHKGRLGADCAKCHRPEKGAPTFNHETMTGFARNGAHRGVACSFCHRPKPDSPPSLGWTKTQTVRSLDLTFPVMGHRCSDCHADPHGGKAGLLCNDCHTTTQFRLLKSAGTQSQKPPDHNQVWLRGHTALSPLDDETEKRACHLCHGSPTCTNCHRTRLPKSHTALWRLRGHGSAAIFESDTCRTCHSRGTCVHCHQTSPPLNHRGAWKISHGFAAGGFANSSCYTCHQRNDCLTCHTRR